MPTTPDRPDQDTGRPAEPEDSASAPAASLAARDTVPLEIRPQVPTDIDNRPTERVEVRQRTPADPRSPADVGNRRTIRLTRRRPGRAPLAVAAAVATAWAALLSYLPVAVVLGLAQFLEGAGTFGGAARLGLAGWLLGHGVPLHPTGVGPIGLAPLLLTLLAAWRLGRAGVHVTRAIGARRRGMLRDAAAVAAAVAVGYGLLGGLAAVLVDGPGWRVDVLRAALTCTAFAAVTAVAGALRCTGALEVIARRSPTAIRHGLRAGVVAALLVFAAGAGLAGLSVAINGGHAAEMIGAYRTGVAGQAGITLVSLSYAPNAAAWAAAYLLGPGFMLGSDTSVRLTEVVTGPLPALPLFAGLPHGPVGGLGAVLLAVPVVAGITAGALMARRMTRASGTGRNAGPGPSWLVVLGSAFLAGPVAGLVLGLAAMLSGGPLGSGRLSQLGPVPWQVATVAAGVVASGAIIGAAANRAFGRRT